MAKKATDNPEKSSTSIRLSPEAEKLRTKLAAKLGINKTAVIELALREFAEKHGVGHE